MRYSLKQKPGRNKWYIQWTEGRRSRYRSTGCEDRRDAEAFLRAFEEQQRDRQDADGCTEVIRRYVADKKGEVVDHRRLEEAAIPLISYFGNLRPHDITEQDCRTYAKRAGAGTTGRELGMLRSALRWSGFADVMIWLPNPPLSRDRFLSKPEARVLLDATASQHVHTFMTLALVTGARKSAILSLTWDRVDLERSIIDFNEEGRPVTKKRRAVVPIGNQVRAMLADIKQAAMTDHVIEWNGKPVKQIKTAFRKAAAKAGVPWCTPHYLKHTAISWMAEDGFSIDQIADMTQTDPATVKRIYRKFNPDYLRALATSQEGRLFDDKYLHHTHPMDGKAKQD